MTLLVLDPWVEDQLRQQRALTGADRYDEVWEGVYVMAPLPTNEHQLLVMGLSTAIHEAVTGAKIGRAYPGVNLSDRSDGWEHNYRAPDVAEFLNSTRAVDCGTHWMGAADFLVEIISPGDRTREKLPFYDSIGVVELLLVDRDPWKLELYQRTDRGLTKSAESTPRDSGILESAVVPLSFRLKPSQPRPQIEVAHTQGTQTWTV
ncbi:MAG: Uma2 family endonuclease [Planctomycetota bacterium]